MPSAAASFVFNDDAIDFLPVSGVIVRLVWWLLALCDTAGAVFISLSLLISMVREFLAVSSALILYWPVIKCSAAICTLYPHWRRQFDKSDSEYWMSLPHPFVKSRNVWSCDKKLLLLLLHLLFFLAFTVVAFFRFNFDFIEKVNRFQLTITELIQWRNSIRLSGEVELLTMYGTSCRTASRQVSNSCWNLCRCICALKFMWWDIYGADGGSGRKLKMASLPPFATSCPTVPGNNQPHIHIPDNFKFSLSNFFGFAFLGP